MRNIYFLHGFLGLPSDWVSTLDEIHDQEELDGQIHLLNIWNSINDISEEKMFVDWADEFASELQGNENWYLNKYRQATTQRIYFFFLIDFHQCFTKFFFIIPVSFFQSIHSWC